MAVAATRRARPRAWGPTTVTTRITTRRPRAETAATAPSTTRPRNAAFANSARPVKSAFQGEACRRALVGSVGGARRGIHQQRGDRKHHDPEHDLPQHRATQAPNLESFVELFIFFIALVSREKSDDDVAGGAGETEEES